MTASKLNKASWNTYKTTGYTHDVGNDQRSAGGVHLHQVRKAKSGWQKRICQSNGKFQSFSEIDSISDQDGERFFEMAKKA